ncbi:MAG: DEAD/DEAH box helicase [Vicingaceae bacterium]
MSNRAKDNSEILAKLEINQLNAMQLEAAEVIQTKDEVILLSPTGTGKTLAFLLPLIEQLDTNCEEIQLLILVPSRELAIQINQVIREMGSGFKTNAVYGGKSGSKDRMELKHRPAILVGTPGRVADHMRRHTFSAEFIQTLVLDEFDKSLEVGFEKEMKAIISGLFARKKTILTSATKGVEIPKFVGLKNPTSINFLKDHESKLDIKVVLSPKKDKVESLLDLLAHLGDQSGIVFCNYKDSIERLSDHLIKREIPHACFYGGLEQIDRERALLKFRNGSHNLIIATDLAARGIDVPELDFIIHYQLPHREEEFTHRNGRTARMQASGTAFIIQGSEERLPDFIQETEVVKLGKAKAPKTQQWETLYVSAGRKDKISKGDVAGFFMKEGNLKSDDLGLIEIKENSCFVAVDSQKSEKIIETLDNKRLKKKKVRVYPI